MIKLRKLLPDSSKKQRCKRNVLNIQITILSWLVEFLGFLTVVLGTAIIGHENAVVTMTFQCISMLFYSVLVPCTILVNSTDVKDYITESEWYLKFINLLGCQPVFPSRIDDRYDHNEDEVEFGT